jgi:uncharacterized damage-inducible protein DinB
MSIRVFYDRWPQYNRRLTEVVGAMSDKQLAISPSPERWPLWATVAHTAGTRVYWLCGVLREPGAEATPWPDALDGVGWEDDLDHPRSAGELVMALDTTFATIDGLLDRWAPDMLSEEFERFYNERRHVHSRGSILQRLFTHDAYHCGELSQTLGINDLPQIDLWRAD